MTDVTTLSSLELSALLCSRVCHDIISPVGAIINGLEVLDDDENNDMEDYAFELIRKSAKQASAKLQFARLAFGAAGSAGAEIDLGDAEQVAVAFLDGEKPEFTWNSRREILPKNKVKLILNLVMISIGAVPRGGSINVDIDPDRENLQVTITCSGPAARIPNHAPDLIAGRGGENGIDAHAVQPYYAGLLAKECGMQVQFELAGEDVIIKANPIAA